MLGLTKKYRLRKHRSAADVYEFLDLESGGLVGVAGPPAAETAARGPIRAILDFLLSYRLTRYCAMAVALVLFLFRLAGAMLGICPLQPRGSRPRLIVRQPGDGAVVFTLEAPSGLFYDSRRVYDGQGRVIALFRSQFKTTVRGGFEISERMGGEDVDKEVRWGPQWGRVEPSGDGRRVYRLRLADNTDAARITREADNYDIDASPALRHDATSQILLLAAALTIAWSPRG
jgi:hypothetical protein